MDLPNERVIPINADHRMMCIFPDQTSQKYQLVEQAVLELANGNSGRACDLCQIHMCVYIGLMT
jgi:hypothetical protein